jgi:cysteine-rich repeat protein
MNERIEECDDGANNSNTEKDACRTDCRNHFCGDGVIDTNEACDDNNVDNSDFCTSGPGGTGGTCSVARCGDDHVRTATSSSSPDPEECDDGAPDVDDGRSNSNNQANACREDCRLFFCGDGVIDANEKCDPGGHYGKGEIGCDGTTVCKPDCSDCLQ